jgi:hypothetical protein
MKRLTRDELRLMSESYFLLADLLARKDEVRHDSKSYLVNRTSYLFLGFYDFAAAEAGRAHADAFGRAANLGAHRA